jgi:LPS-assembly protein
MLAVLPLHAATPELSADKPISYQAETGILTAEGNAVFIDGQVRLEADKIVYDRNRNRVEAEGNVAVTQAGFRLITDWLNYSIEERRFQTGRFRAGYPPLFLEGESFEGTPDEIDFSKVTVYFREPTPGSPRLSIDQGQWLPDVALRGAGLRLFPTGNWNVPLPRADYQFGAPTLKVSGELGHRSSLGAFSKLNIIYPIDPNWGIGGNLDLYSRRGVLIGPSIRYHWGDPEQRTAAFLDAGYIRDQGSLSQLGSDREGNTIGRERAFIDYGLKQVHADGDFTIRGTWINDSEVMRDFRGRDYSRNSEPDNFIETTHLLDNWVLSAMMRLNLNNAYNLTERLPELRMDYLPTLLGDTEIYHQFAFTYSRYRLQTIQDPFIPLDFPGLPLSLDPAARDAEGIFDRIDVYYNWQRPMNFGVFQLTPLATARWTHYSDGWANGARTGDSIDRVMGEVGIDLSTRAEATWDYQNRTWDIRGLRHVSHTFLQYRYFPNGGYKKDEIAAIDRFAYSPLKPTLDLTRLRSIDTLSDLHMTRIGWENRLQTRNRDGSTRDLAEIHFYQDLIMSRDAGRPGWDAFYVEGQLHPAQWLSFGWEQKWRPESQRLEATRAMLTLRDAEIWTAMFSADYLNGAIELYGLDLLYRLNPQYLLSSSFRYNARTSQLTRQRYGIRRSYGRAWELEFYVSFSEGDARKSRTSFGVSVHLLGF